MRLLPLLRSLWSETVSSLLAIPDTAASDDLAELKACIERGDARLHGQEAAGKPHRP